MTKNAYSTGYFVDFLSSHSAGVEGKKHPSLRGCTTQTVFRFTFTRPTVYVNNVKILWIRVIWETSAVCEKV